MRIFKLLVFVLTFGFGAINGDCAEGNWRVIPLVTPHGSIGTLHAMGLQTSAKVDGETQRAFLMLYGRSHSSLLSLDIQIGGDDKIISSSLVDKFRGPDLSPSALSSKPIQILLECDHKVYRFDSRMVIESADWIPGEYRGEAEEVLSTNVPKRDQKEWLRFWGRVGPACPHGTLNIKLKEGASPIIVNIDFNNFNILFRELSDLVNSNGVSGVPSK